MKSPAGIGVWKLYLNVERVARNHNKLPQKHLFGFRIRSHDLIKPYSYDDPLRVEVKRDLMNLKRFTRAVRVMKHDDAKCVIIVRTKVGVYGHLIKESRKSGLFKCSDEDLRMWINCFNKYLYENNIPKNKRLPAVYQSFRWQKRYWIKELWKKTSLETWEELKWMVQRETVATPRISSQSSYIGILINTYMSITSQKIRDFTSIRYILYTSTIELLFSYPYHYSNHIE